MKWKRRGLINNDTNIKGKSGIGVKIEMKILEIKFSCNFIHKSNS